MADERWLRPDEEAAWRAYLVSNQLLMRALDRQLREDSGIPHTYYAVLVGLSMRPGQWAKVTDLAFLMDHSQSRMSHTINRLEEGGWARRERDAADQRVVRVVLTDSGRELLEAAAPGHVRCVRDNLFDGLSAEQVAQFRAVCEVMLDRLGGSVPEF